MKWEPVQGLLATAAVYQLDRTNTRLVDPAARLADVGAELEWLTAHLQAAQAPANRFWSAVGHIGVELSDNPSSGTPSVGAGPSNTGLPHSGEVPR